MIAHTYVFMGKPGSGKGTQARLLADNLGMALFNTSTELRTVADRNPHIDEKIETMMAAGTLVPYWLASFLWQRKLVSLSPDERLVIEGAVRVAEEARLFHDAMQWLERPYTVIELQVSDDSLRTRIQKRAGIEGRSDDAAVVLEERLREYREQTLPSINFFDRSGALLRIDGEPSIDVIHQDILVRLHLS